VPEYVNVMEITVITTSTAKDLSGKIYEIEGIELTRQEGIKVFYDTSTGFAKAVLQPYTIHQGFSLPNGKLVIV
jgi:hypothetical protein